MTMFASQWLANPSTGYTIDQSIRFNSADSATMNRSFGTPTDQNKFTYAFWVKSTKQQNGASLGTNVTGGVTFSTMIFNGGNMAFYDYTSGSANIDVRTTFTSNVGKFKDYSAWYHAMFVYDSDQGTDSNRLKFYINGVQFPVADIVGPGGGSPIWPSSGFNSKFNASGTTHLISDNVNGKLDGYMADIYFLDGVAATPSDFGEFDADSNQFVPIAYSGSFGNNGFHIDGRDSSDLGDDESGNGNDFSTSGLTAADQVSDSPTDNFPTLNSNFDYYTSGNTSYFRPNFAVSILSEGNLKIDFNSPNTPLVYSTATFPSSGKFYFEVTADIANGGGMGIGGSNTIEDGIGSSATTGMSNCIIYNSNGNLFNQSSTQSSYGNASSIANGEFVGVAVDIDNDAIWFCDNGTWVDGDGTDSSATVLAEIEAGTTTSAAATSFLADQNSWHPMVAAVGDYPTYTTNFGQSSFTGAAPAGFTNLTTTNLPDPTIADGSKYYHNQTYTGTGSSGLAITNTASAGDFKPDILWLAPRSNGDNHVFFDSVRGTTQRIKSNSGDAEDTDGTAQITFEADGFDLDTTDPNFNGSGNTYVAWQWHTTGGTSGSNTDGDITSTVSANTTAGFSALTYTGNGSDNQEIGHGIGIAPKMIITKRRDSSGNWTTYHDAVGINQVFYLNSTALPTSNTEQYRAVPTSSVYTVGAGGDINSSGGTYLAYVFAEVDGFSKISSYTGNGSTDGSFVFTGFKPSWIMLKRITGSTQEWQIYDAARDPYNMANHKLEANSSTAESILTSDNNLDILSNGFKLLQANGGMNASGSSYIYLAFAECPFKTANARGITTNGA